MEAATAQSATVPKLGLGTAGMTGKACQKAVEHALSVGYRHIDTAQMYDNEDAVGAAIAASEVPRSEVFVVTKIHRRNLAYDDVLQSFEASLSRLGTDTVDLLLIHAPSGSIAIDETIRAMNELQHDDLVYHIGVSNFSINQTKEAMTVSETPIITNQVEYNPFHEQPELLEFCIENDVILTAYSPLARGKIVGNETLQEIGTRYGKTEAQVALRWLLQQQSVIAIPKSSSPTHIQENIDIFDFSLTNEEIRAIFDLQGGVVDRLRSTLGI